MASILDPLGNATHTALSFDLVGEDVLDYRCWSDWHHGRTAIARYAGARHVVVTDVNDYRLGLATEMGAPGHAQRHSTIRLDDTMQDLGMEEGFRRRHGDVRKSAGLSGHAAHDAPWRQDRIARHTTRGD